MEEPHLDPCPFCGGENLLLQVQENGCVIKGSLGKGKVICGTCSARGPEVPWMKPILYQNFRQLVAKKWNTHDGNNTRSEGHDTGRHGDLHIDRSHDESLDSDSGI